MRITKNNIAFILILISIIAAIFSFKVEYSKHQALIAKYQNIDTSKYKMLTPPEIFQAIGEDQWELGFLIKDGKIIKPMKEYKPRIFVTSMVFILVMNCGTTYNGGIEYTSDQLYPGEINFTPSGYLEFNLNSIPRALIVCSNEAAYQLGSKVFIPALDSKMAIYKVDDALVLNGTIQDSSFIFFSKE
jgi:hypothetical protein